MLLIAGGIGITPIRSMVERMRGDVVVVHRVLTDDDLLFKDELDELAAASGLVVHYVIGDHRGEGAQLSRPSISGSSSPTPRTAMSSSADRPR